MPKTILIVDDEIPILLGFEESFRKVGFEVTIAADGASALDALADRHVDSCLIDLKQPDTDGLILAEAILKRIPDARMVAVTAYPDLFEFQAVRQAGFHGYFAKPVPVEVLIQTVAELLTTHPTPQA